MNEFSLSEENFKEISFSQLKTLFEVISKNSGRDLSYIKEKYANKASFFDETFLFLRTLSLVEENKGRPRISLNTDTNFKELLSKSLFRKTNRIPAIANYFKKFSFQGGHYKFKPSVKENLQTSGIRNLLLELGFLNHDPVGGFYAVSAQGLEYFKSTLSRTSALEFEKILRNRNKLGLSAELFVLAYEKKRLKNYPDLIKELSHTSQSDVGAGYDISSFSLNEAGKVEPRFIEVKAVSAKDYSFFWSLNELEVAKALKAQYYLYLIPVSNSGKFDIRKAKYISDPFKEFCIDKKVINFESILFSVTP